MNLCFRMGKSLFEDKINRKKCVQKREKIKGQSIDGLLRLENSWMSCLEIDAELGAKWLACQSKNVKRVSDAVRADRRITIRLLCNVERRLMPLTCGGYCIFFSIIDNIGNESIQQSYLKNITHVACTYIFVQCFLLRYGNITTYTCI